jgi:hypothetical protein
MTTSGAGERSKGAGSRSLVPARGWVRACRPGRLCRRRWATRRTFAAGTALSTLVLGACWNSAATAQAATVQAATVQAGTVQAGTVQAGTVQAGTVQPRAGAPSFPTPLATSVDAGGGTWATVAMGDLNQPLNTFWQLLFRPDGSGSWSDRVEATAVATNGGIVMATGAGSLIVGVRPSHDLTFSPLISTTDAGRSWSNGLLDQGLVARPQSLAEGPGDSALAIVAAHGGAQVVRNTDNLSSWQPMATAHALASAAGGRACSPGALTSVGYLSSAPVIGTSCEQPGVAGVFVDHSGTWRLAGPSLPAQPGHAEVLGVMPSQAGGLAALLGLSSGGAAGGGARISARAGGTGNPTSTTGAMSLVAAWATANSATPEWRTSAPLGLGQGGRLASFGVAPGTGIFALVAGATGRMQLAVAKAPSTGAPSTGAPSTGAPSTGTSGAEASPPVWEHLPAPPRATATVAFLPGGTVDALAVQSTVLTVWALSPGSGAWVKSQVLHVPVQFGSSS